MKVSKINTSLAKRFIRPLLLGSLAFVISFLSVSADLFAQQTEGTNVPLVIITGVVRDAKTKLPIAAAQIRSLNWEAAATSNDSGMFKIKVASYDEVLSVAAFDYGTREISLRGKESVSVDLYRDVFTKVYKTVETLTGEVNNSNVAQSINSIENTSPLSYLSIDNKIQAELGGNVKATTRSGIAGIGSLLFIRGLNSLNANTQPLFIVDGAILDNSIDEVSLHSGFYSNPLTTIDVADIENITVIKDGTSIYGSKGANGVVVINTNRPKGMVTKIRANAFWGVTSQPQSMPVMDGDQFRIYASDIIKDLPTGQTVNENFLNDNPSTTFYRRYHNNTNWDDQVYRTGFTHSYSLSVNGGDEKATYVFSVGYTGDKSVLQTTDFQRLNARFKANINFSSKFDTRWTIGYTTIDRYLIDDGANYLTSPSFLSMIKAPFLSPYRYTVNGAITKDYEDADDFRVGNPGAILANSLNKNKQYRFNIGVTPEYKFSPYISVKDQFSYSLFNIRENFYRPLLGSDSVVYTKPDFVSQNQVRNQESRNMAIYNDAQLVYSRKYNHYHWVNAILGWRYIYNFYESDYGEGHNTANDNYRSLEDTKINFVNGLNNLYKTVSTYANLDYSYKNRYLLTVIFDMDASSRFGQDTEGGVDLFGTKWGLFPSINGAWIISSERFMQNLKFIDRLKLRAGFGMTGNDDVGYYSKVPYLVSKDYMGKAVGLEIGNIANNHIQWETTYRKNVGVDLSIANERIEISADYFKSNTKDLLTLKSYEDITGLDSYWHNSGELTNEGFEVTANFKVLNLSSVKWELGISAGHYKNKIVSLPDGDFTTQILGGEVLTAVGKPAAVFYGYKTKGVFATQTDADNAQLSITDKTTGKPIYFGAGDVQFVDVQPDHIINEKDKQVIGDPNPDVYGSITSRLSYKSFTLDALFTYSYGNDVYNYLRSQLESGSGLYNQSTAMLNRWRAEGQQTSQPKATYGDPLGNARFSDRWIEDGSFVKLKTLTLSYKVPIKVSFIEGMNVWFSVNNLFTITKYLGRDPEFSINNSVFYQGIDMGLIPNTRSYFVGIKLNL